MISFIFFVSAVCETAEETENVSNDDDLKGLLEIVTISPDKCPYNLNNSLNTYCPRLDMTTRKKLAVQMMLCELAKDGRRPEKPYRNNDDAFIKQLSNQEFVIYTTFFTQIDKLCYQTLHLSQYHQIEQILDSTFEAINFSSEFLSMFSTKMSDQTNKSREAIKKIEETVYQSTELSRTVLETLQNSWNNITYILTLQKQYQYHINSAKLYFKVNLIAFLLSFIIPNVFTPILSLTILFGIFEFQLFGVNEQSYIRHMKKVYVIICALIIFSSLRLKLTEIKRRMWDPLMKPKKRHYIR